jgi:hypothetical protein
VSFGESDSRVTFQPRGNATSYPQRLLLNDFQPDSSCAGEDVAGAVVFSLQPAKAILMTSARGTASVRMGSQMLRAGASKGPETRVSPSSNRSTGSCSRSPTIGSGVLT